VIGAKGPLANVKGQLVATLGFVKPLLRAAHLTKVVEGVGDSGLVKAEKPLFDSKDLPAQHLGLSIAVASTMCPR
jgi:hypothetical protein